MLQSIETTHWAVVMKSPSGAVGQIDVSSCYYVGYDQRIEVFGAGGLISIDNVPTLSSQLFNTRGCSKPPFPP